MDRLREMEVFIAVAETGSFARAAASLRLSPASVTRAVSALEDRLGARAFNRTTRSVKMTDVGQRFLQSARRVLLDLEIAEKEAVGETANPQGHLTLSASVTFGRSALAPVVGDFLEQHPRLTASVLLLDRVVNLVEEGVDIAVRFGHVQDSSLIAKRIGSIRRVLVASPAYLAKRGTPSSPTDLRLHSVIAFTGLLANREWRFTDGQKQIRVSLNPFLEINDSMAAVHAAQMGHGITNTLSYIVSDQIRLGTLVPILEAFTLPPQPVHLVYPHARLLAPKVRAFIEFGAPKLKTVLDNLASTSTGVSDAAELLRT